jgi:hypothetical protein
VIAQESLLQGALSIAVGSKYGSDAGANFFEISTGPLKNPADRAIIIPKEDGLHLFTIDSTHPQYSTHFLGGKS